MFEMNNLNKKIDSILDNLKLKHIIIDMSSVNYIDSMGINEILHVSFLYHLIDFFLN
jgi:anti-anti-sigma regulatory factor